MGPMITRNDIEDVDDLSNSLEELVLTEIEQQYNIDLIEKI